MTVTSNSLRLLSWSLLALGLVLAIVGTKALVIARFGTDLPYWDQWVKEGEMIIAPYYEGTLHFGDLFVPHNEHRIAPTLALNLGLTVVSGQWDVRVQCVVNAFLHAALALGLVAFAWRNFSPCWSVAIAWLLTAFSASSLAWENILGGIQSVFYFLAGFSLLAIHGLTAPRGPRALRWWLGLGWAALASVSMGSGFLCVVPAGLIAGWRLVAARRWGWPSAITLATSAAVVVGGWRLRAPAPWHDSIHAQRIGDFVLYAAHCLAWPVAQWSWLCAVVWAPWLALLLRVLRQRVPRGDSRTEAIAAGGCWVLLQASAVAYARAGAGSMLPAPRYCDILAIGVVCNLAAFAVLFDTTARWVRNFALAGWVAIILSGTLYSALPVWQHDLPSIAARNREYEKNVRGYILTGDSHFIETGEVPLPFRDWLRRILDRPSIRAVLPVSVRAPVKLTVDPGHSHGFAPGSRSPATAALDQRAQWGSYQAPKPAVWRSTPVPSVRYQLWRFEMAGQPGAEGLALQLMTPEGAALTAPIAPAREPGDSWHSVLVSIPAGHATIIVQAADATPGKWMAFSEPIEISVPSQWARRFCIQAPIVLVAGIILLLSASLLIAFSPMAKPSTAILR